MDEKPASRLETKATLPTGNPAITTRRVLDQFYCSFHRDSYIPSGTRAPRAAPTTPWPTGWRPCSARRRTRCVLAAGVAAAASQRARLPRAFARARARASAAGVLAARGSSTPRHASPDMQMHTFSMQAPAPARAQRCPARPAGSGSARSHRQTDLRLHARAPLLPRRGLASAPGARGEAPGG